MGEEEKIVDVESTDVESPVQDADVVEDGEDVKLPHYLTLEKTFLEHYNKATKFLLDLGVIMDQSKDLEWDTFVLSFNDDMIRSMSSVHYLVMTLNSALVRASQTKQSVEATDEESTQPEQPEEIETAEPAQDQD